MPVYYDKERDSWRIVSKRVVNGKKHILHKRGFKSKEEAIEYEKKALNDFACLGFFEGETSFTLKRVFLEWKEYSKGRLAQSTLKRYTTFFNMIDETIQNKLIKEIKVEELQFMFDYFITKSHSLVKRVLNHVYNYAYIKGYVESNIIKLIEVKKLEEKEELKEEYLYYNDMVTLVTYLRNNKSLVYQSYAMTIIIGYYSGMRIGEILALKKDDIDFAENQIHITKQLKTNTNKNDEEKITLPKTNASYANIPMCEALRIELKEWVKINPYEIICCNNNGNYIAYGTLYKALEQASLKTCIYYHPHMCRHTLASNIYTYSHDIKLVQVMMRHAHVQLTLDVYTHIPNEEAKKSLDDIFQLCRKEP